MERLTDKHLKTLMFTVATNEQPKIMTSHQVIENGKKQEYELNYFDESNGTKRLFTYGPVLKNALENGKTIIIDEIDNASTWTHDFGDGKGVIAGAYGPWFISLETPGWSGIGIHGTHDPSSIGTCVSEGCVRMNNNELRILKKFVHVGTEVRIQE